MIFHDDPVDPLKIVERQAVENIVLRPFAIDLEKMASVNLMVVKDGLKCDTTYHFLLNLANGPFFSKRMRTRLVWRENGGRFATLIVLCDVFDNDIPPVIKLQVRLKELVILGRRLKGEDPSLGRIPRC